MHHLVTIESGFLGRPFEGQPMKVGKAVGNAALGLVHGAKLSPGCFGAELR